MFGNRRAKKEQKMKEFVETIVVRFERELSHISTSLNDAKKYKDPAKKFIALKTIERDLENILNTQNRAEKNTPNEFAKKAKRRTVLGICLSSFLAVPAMILFPEAGVEILLAQASAAGGVMGTIMTDQSVFGSKKKAARFKRIFNARIQPLEQQYNQIERGLKKELKAQEKSAIAIFESDNYKNVVDAYPKAAAHFADVAKRQYKEDKKKMAQDIKDAQTPKYEFPDKKSGLKNKGDV